MGQAVPADDMPDNIVPADDMPDDVSNPREAIVNEMAAKHKIGDSIIDPIHGAVSGMGHAILGGVKGLTKLVTSRDPDAAADTVNDELAQAYVPPKSDISGVSPKIRPMVENMNQGMKPTALGDFAEEHGASPGVSTALAALPTALSSIAGTKTLGELPKPAAPAPAVVEDAQSMGAAHAPADLTGTSPELQKAVADHPGLPNRDVLDRHVDAETLPLPEGVSHLKLRKGQATRNGQQISDEKNMRADPDTNGILAQSIVDQDSKLGASMGEIQRRATPDIVQRDNEEHGQAAVSTIKDQINQNILDTRAKYKALADANGGEMPLDTSAAVNEITPVLKKKSLRKTVEQHPVLSEIMDSLRNGDPVDFETFEDWRTRLAEVQRGSDGAARTAAGIMHNTLNSMPMEEGTAGLRTLADTARDAAAAHFNTIKRNPAYKAVANDNVDKLANGLHDVDAESPLASSFMNRFVLGNGPSASGVFVSRLKKAVPNPVLHQAIEGATLNTLRNAAGIDPLGGGTFKPAAYAKQHAAIEPKADALLSPETLKNTSHLKKVAGDVSYEPPDASTNRSNTALTLQRFGAQAEKTHGVASEIADYGGDVAANHLLGPIGGLGKRVVSNVFKRSQEAKAAKAIRDAKLKFATDATAHGAGLDYEPPTTRPARARGGKVDHEALVKSLINRWKHAKKETDETTKPLLGVSDAAITKALDVAGAAI